MKIDCRVGCGACCYVISISSPLPGMPQGKPAFTPCVNLDSQTGRCLVWGKPNYPEVCRQFTAQTEYCGGNRVEALRLLAFYEKSTTP